MAGPRYAVVGGGIVGVAVARELALREPDAHVTVLEKEPALALHQTGRNSGVVHAGLYYEPGSLKATLCRRGVDLLRALCAEHDLPYDACGKVVVALDDDEEQRLRGIEQRAKANGVPGVAWLSAGELRELEPHVRGQAALHSPGSAITDYAAVTRRLAELVEASGGTVRTGAEVVGLDPRREGCVVSVGSTERPQELGIFDRVIACAGLQADRVGALAGAAKDPMIIPFRGEYLTLRPERRDLVRGLVYPVPDPRYPFLGVHLTKRVDGEVLVGPNAVLALAREGYGWRDVAVHDLREMAVWPGMRRLAATHWRTGVREMLGSLSRRRFVAAAQRYVPELTVADVVAGPSGVRAQAIDRQGLLVDDFRVTRNGSVVVVRNAPSPAATSSLAIAEHVVGIALAQ